MTGRRAAKPCVSRPRKEGRANKGFGKTRTPARAALVVLAFGKPAPDHSLFAIRLWIGCWLLPPIIKSAITQIEKLSIRFETSMAIAGSEFPHCDDGDGDDDKKNNQDF